MAQEKVEVRINKKTGKVRAETLNMYGEGCSLHLQWVGRLGESDDNLKPEYFEGEKNIITSNEA